MRTRFLVAYDISDPRRLRNVAETMCGYGERIQLSVFECDLTATERLLMEDELKMLIHHDEDQILFVDLGPSSGRGATCITKLGRPYTPVHRGPKVL